LAWARQLQVGGWVVQHVALDTSNDIQTWQAQHPALSRAQTVPLLRPNGQRYWVLVSGPFTTLERANAFAQSTGVPKNHWSRGVASLQASLDREP
jgi:septal ring-binding cell division protein DamX